MFRRPKTKTVIFHKLLRALLRERDTHVSSTYIRYDDVLRYMTNIIWKGSLICISFGKILIFCFEYDTKYVDHVLKMMFKVKGNRCRCGYELLRQFSIFPTNNNNNLYVYEEKGTFDSFKHDIIVKQTRGKRIWGNKQIVDNVLLCLFGFLNK